MPRCAARMTTRGSWSSHSMKQASDNVLASDMTIRYAAERFSVPKSTLSDTVLRLRRGESVNFKPVLGRFKTTFSSELEEEIVKYLISLDNRLMPLTRKEFLKLAFRIAEQLHIEHRFSREKATAGKDFYYAFMRRHPDLSLRTPESTSLMRMVGFNRPQVAKFFSGLETLYNRFNFRPSRIFNADETGVTCVIKNSRVLSSKGKRQVGKVTSCERGKNITLLFAMSALGDFVPPLFIFPRKKMLPLLMTGAPAESIGEAQPNGWIDSSLFLKWIRHFVAKVNPTREDPVLLVVDGHCSHKDLAVLEFATENNVHMISTPPHTTHKLQPLDRSFMKPFKDAYSEAGAKWHRMNPGLKITDYQVAALVSEAYSRTCRMDIAQSGFKCTGIFPFDRDIFSDIDFMGSELTERSEPEGTVAEEDSPTLLETETQPGSGTSKDRTLASTSRASNSPGPSNRQQSVPARRSSCLTQSERGEPLPSTSRASNSPGPSNRQQSEHARRSSCLTQSERGEPRDLPRQSTSRAHDLAVPSTSNRQESNPGNLPTS